MLSILLSIDADIIRHSESPITADHAVRQRFTDFLPNFLLPFGRLISVGSGVSLGVSFLLQTPISRLENSGTDARFPYEVRQIVVIG